jgi:phenylalanyl-tRNA synthetase alpha chain
MSPPLDELEKNALHELQSINNVKELESWRIRYLGKKSQLTEILRSLATLPVENRRAVGTSANEVKTRLEKSLDEKRQIIYQAQLISTTREKNIDVTLPGRAFPFGRLHPISKTLYEICDIFVSMGFQVVEGPEVEWDYYNFEALNIPEEHPARDSMATLWVDSTKHRGERPMLLRTHTTSVSARNIETMIPPIRVVEPGKVYRYEASDATHTAMCSPFLRRKQESTLPL